MSELRFTKDHEWVRVDGDVGTVGISDYAQTQLGDVVYAEPPQLGRKLAKGDQAAVVESVKAASEVYTPVSGEVVAVNDALAANPALVNTAPYGDGWFMKIRLSDSGELAGLMDEKAYEAYVQGLS